MKKYAPATLRNRDPIAAVLREEVADYGRILEIASGSGEHAVHFAPLFPNALWQPSDYDAEALASIAAWRDEAETGNILPPVRLDVRSTSWPFDRVDAIFCANMVHISPPEAAEGLLAGAGRLLHGDAPLILYGPFFEDSIAPVASNVEFDRSLKARDDSWGLRNVTWINHLAGKAGLALARRIPMPANNLILIYRPE